MVAVFDLADVPAQYRSVLWDDLFLRIDHIFEEKMLSGELLLDEVAMTLTVRDCE